MAGYKIQLKDKNGNRQYPVSTTDVVVDADGVSVADLLDRKQPTLVSGVNIKTINGKTLLGEGDLVIEGGTADLSGYATTEYVDAKVGESYPIYYSYDGTPLTEEQKAANKMAIDKYVADESVILYPYMSSVGQPFDVLLTLSEGVWETAELTNYIFASFNDDGTTMHYVKVTVEQDGDVQVEFSAESPLVLASKAYVDSKVGGGSGETAESDVICVVWDDDTSDIPSNKEAYQKLAESINTVGKPAAVMVCVETGYRWGIAKYYWKSNVGGDIELTTPVTESGLYCVFTLTSEGVCTASYKQVDLGGGGNSSNVVSFYIPLMDDSREVVTYENCINEITTRFADSISQEVIDAITSHFQSMIDHNVASFAELEERLRNGEKPMIVMRGFTYWILVLMIYLWAVAEGGGMDMTDDELIAELDLLANIYEVIYPESYRMDFNEDSGAALEVTVESIGVSIGANGNWEKQSETDVRETATLYYEGAARLTAKECETNLKSKGNRLNNCDFQVNRYRGDGWSDNEDVLIIGKSTKTVTDFVDLDGTVSTRTVVTFRYLEDMNMVELQVSTYDGYCRRVVLGKVNVGENEGGGGLKYFVERYVYEGKTEEERTYNLESLAMASDNVDILWAGIYNASAGDTAGSWYARREYDAFVAEAHAYIDSESGILVMEDTSFCRDLRYGSFDVGYDDEREWLVAFFKRDNWLYERAYYGPFPIISWSEESNTVLRAYYLANGLAIANVSVNIETGEVSQPVVGQ